MLECQQRYVLRMIQAQRVQRWAHAEVRAEAQRAFVAEVRERSGRSTFESGCTSWYLTADGRNTNNWIGSMTEYARRTAAPRMSDYVLQHSAE